jgi:hypothetical protein
MRSRFDIAPKRERERERLTVGDKALLSLFFLLVFVLVDISLDIEELGASASSSLWVSGCGFTERASGSARWGAGAKQASEQTDPFLPRTVIFLLVLRLLGSGNCQPRVRTRGV